ncbi:hypothetical protein ACJIZ3_022843 [Penstemon smallii]|uniref:Uncharacterized protein n=1 Tax=Penstemon smallii TaxID=265156 RepID=A0ABD3TPG3_9LAMI
MNPSAENSTQICAICLGSVETGQGQAIFTAECSHSFHFGCIQNNVTQGNYICPVCRAKWNDVPFAVPKFIPIATPRRPVIRPVFEPEPLQFSDDEPLPSAASDQASSTASSSGLENVTIKGIPERPSVAASESVTNFAVLVRLKAPSLSEDARQNQRAPIDLVLVLDVSGSMHGAKLALLKRAVNFVIDNLGSLDRISLVSFASHASRILSLRRMTEHGREDAKRAVNFLAASGSTNIVEGLKKGVQVLEERRYKNPVGSIIFLSDGQDTDNHRGSQSWTLSNQRQPPSYVNLLPASICPGDRGTETEGQGQTFPVHAFGFGTDHDPITMHAISDSSGGTFSFIESYEMVQDAFASCIGGLLSVTTQELRLIIKSASNGVDVKSIPSGRYASEISKEGSQGMISVGDLYAEEEKEFLIYVTVPILREESELKTSLLDIMCSYRDVVSKEMVNIECDLVEILRPKMLSLSDMMVNLEVDRQRNRLSAAESIAEAQQMAETGNLSGAQALLSERRSTILASEAGQKGDDLSMLLEAEMNEAGKRMGSRRMYERSGRAYALSSISSHANQRHTTKGNIIPTPAYRKVNSGGAGAPSLGAYTTQSMANMVLKSQQLSKADVEGYSSPATTPNTVNESQQISKTDNVNPSPMQE